MEPGSQKDMETWIISNRLNHFQTENTNVADITLRVNYSELDVIAK